MTTSHSIESALSYLAVARPRLHASFRASDATVEWVYPAKGKTKADAGWSRRRMDVVEAADKIRVREQLLAEVRETKVEIEALRQQALSDCRTAWEQAEGLPESIRTMMRTMILERAVVLSHRDLDARALRQGAIQLG